MSKCSHNNLKISSNVVKQNDLKPKIHICYLPAGRSVLGKTVPVGLSTKAAGTDLGHSFSQYEPNRPRPAKNVFIFFSVGNYFIRNISVDFLLEQFHTVRVRLTFRTSKAVLFAEVFFTL